jgi:hypothetical protein
MVSSEPNIATDAGEAIGNLWNPSASLAIRVTDVTVSFGGTQTTAYTIRLSRTSTKGTAASTRNTDESNHYGLRAGPASVTTLECGNFTVNPTEVTPELMRAFVPTPIGTHVEWWFPEPIIVTPGSGLAVYTNDAGSGTSISFRFEE